MEIRAAKPGDEQAIFSLIKELALYEKAPEDVFKLCYSNILKWNYEINQLSVKLNIPVTYYEDLYNPEDERRLRKGDRNKSGKKLI